ncbi:glutamate--cysteine ligase GCS2 [Desulfurispirillum indicum S5]|uniref:Glutamate--cysteine ligase GCS2 n=1 Tax=Desulfurispirillum indicum (strain ATCC BAA-1389 / DSM 22839 / S5) TaxID=653733 RepID=E6W0P8_DESIS|nr:glutamate-cysteine ligase family protein [Desulfurispirillum indicum]ADU66393.1 glutamate--cysteine ligase GCS2 [Desulfurispirillum indicum S5]
MTSQTELHLFEGYGIELEYMVVDLRRLNVLPIVDRLLQAVSRQEECSTVQRGKFAWSNELARHVIEIKTHEPTRKLMTVPEGFQKEIQFINKVLESMGGVLLPTSMHPWMNPEREMQLWPYGNRAIYQAYDRIFNCHGHGWANIQSAHMNLPFSGDQEFRALHAAIRMVLPLIPALSSSSPIMDGKLTGISNNRLTMYRQNQHKIPLIAGGIIPEIVNSQADYEERILKPMYNQIAPHDPDGILQHEWLNSRGAIARFDRNSIELRLLDIQECPLADISIMHFIAELVRSFIEERWCPADTITTFPGEALGTILDHTIARAENAIIDSREYLEIFGHKGATCSAQELLGIIMDEIIMPTSPFYETLSTIIGEGSLSTRIARSLGTELPKKKMLTIYEELFHCLHNGIIFHG